MKERKSKSKIKALTGGEAVAEALRQIEPDIFATYPITPQTPIIETFARLVAQGKAKTEFVPVESEHTALSYVIGAQAAGARACTATASQGLAYMWEVLPVASGMRLPVLMPLACRALSSPINIHNDHSDAIAMRDCGWIQIFAENPQECYDLTILALKLAENKKVLLPATVMQDGFTTSHCTERVEILSDQEVKNFIGQYSPDRPLLDIDHPKTYGPITSPENHFEVKRQINEAVRNARKVFVETAQNFSKLSGRKYSSVEKYYLNDAQAVIVCSASTCGTIKYVVNKLRKEGIKVGLLKIVLFRPFPYQEIQKALEGKRFIAVFDRSNSYGADPVLFTDIKNALYNLKPSPRIQSYIFGLGGRDIFPSQIEKVYRNLLKGKISNEVKFLGLKE